MDNNWHGSLSLSWKVPVFRKEEHLIAGVVAKYLQTSMNHFSNRWRREYLPAVSGRHNYEHLREVESNVKDTSEPVARHFNLANHTHRAAPKVAKTPKKLDF